MGLIDHPGARRRLVGATAVFLAASGLAVAAPAAPASAQPCPLLFPCNVDPAAKTAVAISGDALQGSVLTLTPPVWDQSNVATTYQWWRDSTAIDDATGTTYTTSGADVGHAITVVATGTNPRSRVGTSASNAITVTAPPTPTPVIDLVTAPVVTGRAAVGELLSTTLGEWRAPAPAVAVQWYRRPAKKGTPAFVPIKRATSRFYELRPGDAGATLATVVTASADGEESVLVASNLVKVAKLATTVSIQPVRRTIKRKQRAKVVITLTSVALTAPTGRVVVLVDGKKLAKVSPKHGTARIKLRKLPRGKHVLQARYAGTRSYATSVSRKVRLRVK